MTPQQFYRQQQAQAPPGLAPIAVTQVQAAKLMGVSTPTIWRWDRAGIIKGRRIGGVKLYSYAKLKALVEGDEQPALASESAPR
jgi:hypothetical protein